MMGRGSLPTAGLASCLAPTGYEQRNCQGSREWWVPREPVGILASRMAMLRQRVNKHCKAGPCDQDTKVITVGLQPGMRRAGP